MNKSILVVVVLIVTSFFIMVYWPGTETANDTAALDCVDIHNYYSGICANRRRASHELADAAVAVQHDARLARIGAISRLHHRNACVAASRRRASTNGTFECGLNCRHNPGSSLYVCSQTVDTED